MTLNMDLKGTCTKHCWVRVAKWRAVRGAHASEGSQEVNIIRLSVSQHCFPQNIFWQWCSQSRNFIEIVMAKKYNYSFKKPSHTFNEQLNTSSQKFIKTATEINTRPRDCTLKSHLSKGISAVASFLFRVLLVNDVAPCSHSSVKKGFLHHVRLRGEQVCYDGHNFDIFNKGCVTIHYKF